MIFSIFADVHSKDAIEALRQKFVANESLSDSMHNYMLQQFKIYLLVGGMPDAINKFLENRNIAQVRAIQQDILTLYKIDASQYDADKKLVIRKIYDMIPSNMENKKKRIIVKNIEGTKAHKQFSDYANELEHLTVLGCRSENEKRLHPVFLYTECSLLLF